MTNASEQMQTLLDQVASGQLGASGLAATFLGRSEHQPAATSQRSLTDSELGNLRLAHPAKSFDPSCRKRSACTESRKNHAVTSARGGAADEMSHQQGRATKRLALLRHRDRPLKRPISSMFMITHFPQRDTFPVGRAQLLALAWLDFTPEGPMSLPTAAIRGWS
jgi:hypothetical protein